MFDLFGIKGVRKQVERLEENFHQRIDQVCMDQGNLAQWISYLHHEHRTMQHRVAWRQSRRGLDEQQVLTLVEKHAAFDIILDRIKQIEHMMAKTHLPVEKIEQKVADRVEHALTSKIRRIAERVEALEERRPPKPVAPTRVGGEKPFSQLQHRLLKRIAKHPKTVVKSAILSLVRKYGRILGVELREMVVDEQRLCSRSSFYRLLEELEKEGQIESVAEGREKLFLDGQKLSH